MLLLFAIHTAKAQDCLHAEIEKDIEVSKLNSEFLTIQFLGYFENDSVHVYLDNKIVFRNKMISGNDKSSTDGSFFKIKNKGVVKVVLPQKKECYYFELPVNYKIIHFQYGYAPKTEEHMMLYVHYANELLHLE